VCFILIGMVKVHRKDKCIAPAQGLFLNGRFAYLQPVLTFNSDLLILPIVDGLLKS
jgi:hypothetical protein